jgi:alanine racemase
VSYIEISKSNLLHNIDQLSKRCGKEKLAVVLKDNAYGHGLGECAKVCAEAGVRHAIVRDNEEALAVSWLFESVLVLADAKTPQKSNIHIAINRLEDIEKLKNGTKVHLKVDTGMHRNGISIDNIDIAMKMIVENGLIIVGLFSHLRSADELSSECFWQEKNFAKARATVTRFCEENSLELPKFHLHNSAGTLRKSSFEAYDMVRTGIALYGYLDMPSSFETLELKPVMKLFAERISEKNGKTGNRIGYGGALELSHDTKLGVYDVGYADGFMRLNERMPYATPDDEKVSAKVSMDNIIIESEKAAVCLFDDARALAKVCDTIVYDILVKLSPKIKRVIT